MIDLCLSSPIWFAVLTSLVPLTLKIFNGNKELKNKGIVTAISVCGLIISISLLLYFWQKDSVLLFYNSLAIDPFRQWSALALLILTVFVVLVTSIHPQVDASYLSETLFLYLNATAGLIALTYSNNLMMAFVSLELASMAFYLLIALGIKGRTAALFASFKYFVLGSLASAILLYGMAFTVGSVHHFNLVQLLEKQSFLLQKSQLLVLGILFISVGFLFKISIFPFQFWLPDVYRGSFTPLLILMAGGMKLAVFTLLYQWTKNLFSLANLDMFLAILQWMAVLSVLFGNILAVLQNDFKKLLLFSTIAHSGYLLMLYLSATLGATLAPFGLMYYLILYAAMTAGSFICLLPLESSDHFQIPISRLKGLSKSHPFLAFSITIFLLSLAGIPPLAGFIAKLFMFHSLLDSGLWWLLFWGILGSAIAFYYYLKPVAFMYMYEEEKKLDLNFQGFGAYLFTTLCIILIAVVILMGIFPLLVKFN